MSSQQPTQRAHLLDFKTALVTGGGGGLGYAMAEWLHKVKGKKVILAGRTESNLKEAAKKLGGDTTYYVLDTGKVDQIESFAKKLIEEHPDVDCLINNAGVQRPLEVTNLDLGKLDQEIDINIRGPIYLANALLKHFGSKPHAVVMNVTSVLGFVPFSIINPAYNGSKAYMHFWSMAQRTQLKNTPIRICEVIPPSVHTDLHREREDPDDNNPSKSSALTVEDFIKQITEQWEDDQDHVTAGMGKELVKKWYDAYGEQFDKAADAWEGKKIA
ncbi:unnamed protein product [Parajaminaea phylloscopi]